MAQQGCTVTTVSSSTAWPPDVCTSAYVRATQVGRRSTSVPGQVLHTKTHVLYCIRLRHHVRTHVQAGRMHPRISLPRKSKLKSELVDTDDRSLATLQCGALQLTTSSATQLPTWRGHRHRGTTRRLSRTTLGLGRALCLAGRGSAPFQRKGRGRRQKAEASCPAQPW